MNKRRLTAESLENRQLLAAEISSGFVDGTVAELDALDLESAYFSRAIPSAAATTRLLQPASGARSIAANNGGFHIEIVPGLNLRSMPDALEAARRAADQWEAMFFDPITVTIHIDILSQRRDFLDGVLGLASPVELELPYSEVRAAMQSDGLIEGDDSIVGRLPDQDEIGFAYPNELSPGQNIALSKANLKALGLHSRAIDDELGVSDGRILLNPFTAASQVGNDGDGTHFDFNSDDGIEFGDFDFETIVVHEIGHILGFISAVDRIDNVDSSVQIVAPSPMDLFRFRSLVGPDNPRTPAAFETIRRELRPSTPAVLDFVLQDGWSDLRNEYPVELGVDAGLLEPGLLPNDVGGTANQNPVDFGYQASHWQSEDLSGETIGVLAPAIGSQTVSPISNADVRIFDLIGYDALPPDVPASAPELADDQAVIDGVDRLVIDVLANDQNNNEALDLSTFRIVEPPALGTTTFDPVTGLLVYQPEQVTADDLDILTYTIADSRGLYARPAVVEISLTGRGVAPTAVDDFVLTRSGQAVTFHPLSNDFDADDDLDISDLSITSGPTNGTIERFGQGLVYTPIDGFQGSDALTYSIQDSRGNAASATVQITVGTTLGPVVIPGNPLTLMQRADTNGDSRITAIDALVTVNFLSRQARTQPTGSFTHEVARLDVSGDGLVSALDALLIINLLGQTSAAEAEAEAVGLNELVNKKERDLEIISESADPLGTEHQSVKGNGAQI